MRITVMGTGGVGGYFGARLAQGGADVGFVARGAQLEALRTQGLRVESALGDVHLESVRASEDPAALGDADLVLVCTKLWDLDATAKAIAPVVGPATAVLSLQNGVTKDDVLRAAFGAPRVLGGVVYIASAIASPGVIRQTGKLQRMVFGEYDGASSARVNALLEHARAGGIDVETSADIRRVIWEKFVFLVGMSAATTSIRASIGPIRTNAHTRAFLLDLMREVVAVGRAHGVPLAEDFAEQRMAFIDTLPPEMDSSMHGDLRRGGRLEVAWLSGAAAELGAAAGVPTPLNRAVRGVLALWAGGASRA